MMQVTVLPAGIPTPLDVVHGVVELYACPLVEISQVYEYGADPDDGIVSFILSNWLGSIFGLNTVGADGAVSWVDTAMVFDVAENALSGAVAESAISSAKL